MKKILAGAVLALIFGAMVSICASIVAHTTYGFDWEQDCAAFGDPEHFNIHENITGTMMPVCAWSYPKCECEDGYWHDGYWIEGKCTCVE